MTNPLPDWYIERLRRDGRLSSLQAMPRASLPAVRHRASDFAELRRLYPQPEPELRGPFLLRLRLWWMRLWLPKDES